MDDYPVQFLGTLLIYQGVWPFNHVCNRFDLACSDRFTRRWASYDIVVSG